MSSTFNWTDLNKNKLSDLKREAEKLQLNVPSHPTKKQIINILLSEQQRLINISNEEVLSSKKCQSKYNQHSSKQIFLNNHNNSIKNKTIENHNKSVIDNQDKRVKYNSQKLYKEKREQSPLLPSNNHQKSKIPPKASKKVNNKFKNLDDINFSEKKTIYRNKIIFLCIMILVALIILNPIFFIIVIICIIGIIFPDLIAQIWILFEKYVQ